MNIFNLIKEEHDNNVMTFYHGGNLDDFKSKSIPKKGRYEFGVGLYLTDSYNVVEKYRKGSRKLYRVEVYYGNNIDNSFIDYDKTVWFIKSYAATSKRNSIIGYLNKYNENNKVPADIFNNLLLNHDAIKGSKTIELKNFLVDNNIDYELHHNNFGFNDTTMTLFNTNKIKSIDRIQSNDEIIQKFDNKYN